MNPPQIFISYAGHDAFPASLLQFAVETLLTGEGVVAWTFQRDQARNEREIAQTLKQQVRVSMATIFLLSPTTLDHGPTQWMELAYADAFDVPTYILLYHIDYQELKQHESVPPLVLSSQCNPATEWRAIVEDIRRLVEEQSAS